MKVLIAAGGSGGHIFPAIALAKELIKDNVEAVRCGTPNEAEIIFVASRRGLDKKILQKESCKKIFLSANPMPYRFGLGLPVFLIKLFVDSLYALFLLMRFRPDIVIGFGGYTAGAIVLLASILNIKTIIHEQNVIPSRTNKFLDRFVDGVAISFSETKKYLRNRNIIFTGNPLREESLKENRRQAFSNLGLNIGKSTILVMGGSQGAKSLNNFVSRSISLLPIEKKESVQLVHIAGPAQRGEIEKRYSENGISGKVFGFVQNINEAYSVCDLAISRAGAAAIFELAAFKKPMILIPYPHPRNNQRFNAQFFEKNGAAIYKDEAHLNDVKLKDLIIDLIENSDKRKTLSKNAEKLSVVDGAKRLKELVLITASSAGTSASAGISEGTGVS